MHHLGQTRSAKNPDYLLQTPDTFVRTPLPGLSGGLAVVHAAPQMGAGFAMMTVELEPEGTLIEGPAQRFLYVLEGDLLLRQPESPRPRALGPGSFAYLPLEHAHMLQAESAARVVLIDKPYVPLEALYDTVPGGSVPAFFASAEGAIRAKPLDGDGDLQVRALLPDSLAFDFAVQTVSYAPGASLPQVKMQYMEHGLLMLEGAGTYRLGEARYAVEAGDFIWMGPFCPQWFCALDGQPAKYLIYNDLNRHVLS